MRNAEVCKVADQTLRRFWQDGAGGVRPDVCVRLAGARPLPERASL